ncbi:aspartate/glutamate racemase family protein [Streptomyces sp. NBC_00144]|uniref:aspartate/glutamate racemase family protein n=1 Tax=Streptomyces sp. NBC_00144 TaxID=2975665 RepID=UPI00324E3CEB
MPRVLVIVPFPFDDEGMANRSAQLEKVSIDPGVEFHYRSVKAGPANFDSYHDWLLADLGMLEAGLRAQEEGFDAVCIDTTSDSGMNALRSVLDIPVIAPGRASYLTALMLGHRFGVLTQWDPWIHEARKALVEYGLDHLCVGIESINRPPDMQNLLGGKEEEVFPLLRDAGMRLVDKGADALCLGSTTMHQAVAYLNENLPIPVIDPGPLTYKMAEMLLGMGLSHSRKAYAAPHQAKPDLIHAMLEKAASIDGVFGQG